MPQKLHEPSTYCSGSPREPAVDQLVERGRGAHRRGRVASADLLGRVEPGHLFEHPAHLDVGLLDPGRAQPLARPRRAARAQVDQRAQEPSSSWRRRSSAISASTISSSSPGEHLVEVVRR